ncbi:hypothetical protein [Bacillus massiliigorillae]|nr:hypothetical protein [Bacillus massiliigorillae]
MHWAWVRHHVRPDEFYKMPLGAKTLLIACIEKEIKDESDSTKESNTK